jgi:LysM repeat protein
MLRTGKRPAPEAGKRGRGAARWLAGSSAVLIGAGLASPALATQHYVVKSGDFLYRIARQEGVSPRRLVGLNHLAAPYRLMPGQRLVLRGLLGDSRPAELASLGRSHGAGARYQVKRGDWLLHIAHVEGVSPERLEAANGLSPPYRVYVGQTLVLPLRGRVEASAERSRARSAPFETAVASPPASPPLTAPAPAAEPSSMVLPVYDDATRLGDLNAYIDPDGIVSVDAPRFADLVKRVLGKARFARVKTVLARKALIEIVSIDNSGLIVTYDSSRQRIVVDIAPSDRVAALAPAASVTAVGRLVDAGGAPISLEAGSAVAEAQPRVAPAPIFTTRDGRFVASGLRPGRWRIELPSSPGAVFEIDVPKNGGSFLRLGDLWPT